MPENAPTDESVTEPTSDVTEGTPPAEPAPAAPTSDTPPKETESERPSRARDRIQDLVAQNRAAIEFADMQKARADELDAKLKAIETPKEPAKMPLLKDFETPEEWGQAVLTYADQSVDQRVKSQVAAALKEAGVERSAADRQKQFTDSMLAAAEKHDDYWEVVRDPTATFMNGALLETVMDMDQPGEIVYYLNSHPAEARAIAALGTPAKIGAAIGRLNLETTKPRPPDVTKAPDPPTQIGGGPSGDPNPNKMSTKEYIEWRIQERAAKRRPAGAS